MHKWYRASRMLVAAAMDPGIPDAVCYGAFGCFLLQRCCERSGGVEHFGCYCCRSGVEHLGCWMPSGGAEHPGCYPLPRWGWASPVLCCSGGTGHLGCICCGGVDARGGAEHLGCYLLQRCYLAPGGAGHLACCSLPQRCCASRMLDAAALCVWDALAALVGMGIWMPWRALAQPDRGVAFHLVGLDRIWPLVLLQPLAGARCCLCL